MTRINIRNESGEAKKALVLSHCQLSDLYNIVSLEKDAEEEALRRAEEMEERKEMSRKMAETWENTYVNMRRLRYEKIKERALKEQHYKEKRFSELREESEKEKQKLRDKASRILFFERDACKSFHTAFRTSESIAEMQAQLEFNEKLKKLDKEIEAKYAASILDDAQRYREELEQEKLEIAEKKKLLKVEAKAMLEEAERRKKEEKEKQQKEEKEDMEIMLRQLKQVEENEKLEIERKKAFVRNNLYENREMVKKNEERLKQEEEEENKALQIIAMGKNAIAQIRRQRELEMLSAKRERHHALASKIFDNQNERDKKEQESLQNAIEEKYKMYLDAKEKEDQNREMQKQSRIKEHMDYMKQQEERQKKEKELLKWEILKRLEKEERDNAFKKKLRDERLKRTKENKDYYLKRIETDVEKRMKEKQEDFEASQRAQELWELSDEEFLAYALKVREESKKKDRPLYPLDAAIYKYKKLNDLLEKGKNFIWEAKVKKPGGTDKQEIPMECKENKEEMLKYCMQIKAIGKEDCGCAKKANGLAD